MWWIIKCLYNVQSWGLGDVNAWSIKTNKDEQRASLLLELDVLWFAEGDIRWWIVRWVQIAAHPTRLRTNKEWRNGREKWTVLNCGLDCEETPHLFARLLVAEVFESFTHYLAIRRSPVTVNLTVLLPTHIRRPSSYTYSKKKRAPLDHVRKFHALGLASFFFINTYAMRSHFIFKYLSVEFIRKTHMFFLQFVCFRKALSFMVSFVPFLMATFWTFIDLHTLHLIVRLEVVKASSIYQTLDRYWRKIRKQNLRTLKSDNQRRTETRKLRNSFVF